jgi:diguanylate cyclase (GGDEF)-like protein
MVLSLAVNYLLLFSDTLTPFGRSIASAAILPLVIGIPVFAYAAVKLEEVRRYRRELTYAANHDRQTGFFNGAALGSMIERRAGEPQPVGKRQGAFLIVEAGKMRDINMRHGLAWSEEALKLIADTIRASVRGGDIVGRISANEFGVFLPGASEENAVEIGERIRVGVRAAYFAPGGEADMLEAKVAGVVFESDLSFDDMFRATEKLMAEAGPADRLKLSFLDRGDQIPLH